MPTCTFCGSVNSTEASRCTLCDQVLVKETGPSKADQATGARISRYGEDSASDQSRPPRLGYRAHRGPTARLGNGRFFELGWSGTGSQAQL